MTATHRFISYRAKLVDIIQMSFAVACNGSICTSPSWNVETRMPVRPCC